MNISFFQTYGDRLPLLKIRMEDILFKKLISNFDINIIALHNTTDAIKAFVSNNAIVPNQLILIHDGMNYGSCIANLLKFAKENQTYRILFYQDDTFSYELSEENYVYLHDMIFNFDYEMLNLSYKMDYLREHKLWNEKKNVLYQSPIFNLYDVTTADFNNSGLWAFDDSCYISTYKKMIQIYDNRYLQYSDIWSAEHYLKAKYTQDPILRPITDVSFFINYNIIGRNINEKNKENLKRRLKLSPETLALI